MDRKQIVRMLLLCLTGLALLAAGCRPAFSSPEVNTSAKPVQIAVYATPPPFRHTVTVYNLTLELEVKDTHTAAAEAMRLNTSFGGYLVTNQTWFENGQSVVFLEFAVPDGQSARLHSALLQLGRVIAENYATYAHDCLNCQPFSHISLYLRSSKPLLSPLPASGWNPVRTLRAALSVFTGIFSVMADGIIWLVVVGGPFVLMGWGLVALARRLRSHIGGSKPAGSAEKPGDEKSD